MLRMYVCMYVYSPCGAGRYPPEIPSLDTVTCPPPPPSPPPSAPPAEAAAAAQQKKAQKKAP